MAPADLTAFCEQEWPRLVGALSLYTGDADLAEELAQEAIARACRHWRRVRRMDAPAAWLHRVARNLAHSHFRRVSVGRRVQARVSTSDQTGDDADVIAIRAAVGALPVPERETIVLRYYVGCSVRETADAMQCPEGTVKTRTYRAIAMLRASGIVDLEVLDA